MDTQVMLSCRRAGLAELADAPDSAALRPCRFQRPVRLIWFRGRRPRH